MIYKVGSVVRDVRVALDQNNTSAALLPTDDIDTLTLDEIIESKVEEGVRRVHMEAPVYMLESGHHFGDSVYWNGDGTGHILLPDDFLRLIVFRMSDWRRAVYRAIDVAGPDYAKQSSRFCGIRGNTEKPVCAITARPEGLCLEFYSCKDEAAQVVEAVYQPAPHIDSDEGIDISERCYTAVVYMIAALVTASCGDTNRFNTYAELAKSLMQ